jgi:dethiobiotin synthetase
MRGFVVAGIGTEVGKTIVSAIMVQRLKADYWKPVQAGNLDQSDTLAVQQLAPCGVDFHPEAYRLKRAMSPHAAAEKEGVLIEHQQMALPPTGNTLVVELAGGLMAPLAPGLTNIDLLTDWKLPVVLVSSYYLGSINHTLLSVDALTQRNISLLGLVFNGDPVESTRRAILESTGLRSLLDIARADRVDSAWMAKQVENLQL